MAPKKDPPVDPPADPEPDAPDLPGPDLDEPAPEPEPAPAPTPEPAPRNTGDQTTGIDIDAIASKVVEKLTGVGTMAVSAPGDMKTAVDAALAEREHREQHERMASSGRREHRGLFRTFFPDGLPWERSR